MLPAVFLARPLLLAPTPAAPAPATDSCLWVATESSLIRVEAADGSITLEIPGLQQPRAVALDQQRGAVWVFGRDHLRCFTTAGVLLIDGMAPKGHEGEPAHLTVVPADGSVWLATGKVLYHFNAQAQALATIAFPDKIQALQLDLPRSILWCATGDAATALDPSTGGVMCSFGLGKNAALQDLAISPATGDVWMALKDTVRRYSSVGQMLAEVGLKKVEAVAGDGQERLWAATDKELLRLDTSGLPLLAVALPKDAGATVGVVADLGTSTAWVATQHGLTHVSAFGQILGIVDFHQPEHHVLAVAFPGDVAPPILHITEPSDGTFTKEPAPPIKVEYSDAGFGVNTESLAFKIDGDPLEVTCTREETNATCSPTNNLQDGAINLSATVQDFAGNTSQPAAVTFTVDTVPPQITLTSPVEGSITNQKDQTLSGSLSETATLKVSGQPAQVNEGRSFSYGPVTLIEGLNTFDLEATDPAGNVGTLQLNVTLDTVPPQITLTSPANGSITNRQQQTFSGSLSEAGTLTLNGQPVTVDDSHTFNHGPVTLSEGANSFTLQATDAAGNVGSLSVTVTLDSVPPTSPDPAKVTVGPPSGGLVAVTGSAGAVEVGVNVAITNLRTAATVMVSAAADGSFAGSIAGEAGDTLRLIAIDLAGNASPATSLVVPGGGGPTVPPDPASVAPLVDPTVATNLHDATAFLYEGANPIQTGVAPGTIEPKRACVLRGRVLDGDGAPLPGVAITVKDHPELGQTLSRLDGMFDLAVNGGGLLTIGYRKDGLLPAQRQVNAPWQDWAWLPDVVLIPQDPQVTPIDLTQPVMQVARGSVITDGDGTRQATLLVPPGTTAELVMPDGSRQPITTLHVRATEYTVGERGPEAMPAELPPASEYTYCFKLSAEEESSAGATSTVFNQPIPFYIENFLGLPVGFEVPLGAYDPALASWVAEDNGVVVKILGVNGGLAELDVDGTGIPADAAKLAAFGVTEAERQQLAALYQPGASLWRLRVPHLSDTERAWDANMGWAMPADATSGGRGGNSFAGDGRRRCQSIVEAQAQILGESLPIAASPFTLNYRSNRSAGWAVQDTLLIDLSGESVPASLKRIDLVIEHGGRLLRQTFPAAPNQSIRFPLDRRDAYGRPLAGLWPAIVHVGYVYDAVYQEAPRFGYNGNGTRVTINTRDEVALWRDIPLMAGGFDVAGQGLGGWTLSPHHLYDPVGRVLYYGDGERRDAEQVSGMLLSPVPGIAATGVAVGADGSIYAADPWTSVVRKRAPDGTITVVAGIPGAAGFSGDGGPAIQARLSSPQAVALGPDGSLYIADQQNDRIRRVAPDGIITTFAGNGQAEGWHGDGLPATQGVIGLPEDVAVGPDGTVYVAQGKGWRVRRIGPDGLLGTVAGQGWCSTSGYCYGEGFGGDGGLATAALLSGTFGVAVDPDGTVYIADRWNGRVRRVGTDGIITTVAGSGSRTHSGDGGSALLAGFDPHRLAVGPDGALFISDVWAHVIRRVGLHGIITTFAGTPWQNGSVNNVPATQGKFGAPFALAFAPDGDLIVADQSSVRRVHRSLSGFTADQIVIPSEDGREVFAFDSDGRHLRTVDALTGSIVYAFAYDAAHQLVSVTDADGNITTVERDGSGNATAIVAPDGQRTALAVDGSGHLASMTNPAGDAHAFTYTPEGLLTSMTNPRGNASTFTYDELGRLEKDTDAAGGFIALSRTESLDHLSVSATTGEGRVTTYTIDRLPTGDESRTVSEGACCAESEAVKGTDGSTTTMSCDGTVRYTLEGPDPRFGMSAPIVATSRVTLPSGLMSATTASRTVVLSNPLDPFSLTAHTDTVTVNGRTTTTHYDAAQRRFTTTSPMGRQSITFIDTNGKVTSEQIGGLAPITYAYDARGRLSTVTQGTRTSTLTYDSAGNLALVTDPIGPSMTFTYDPAGRVTVQTLADGRSVGFTYDPAGNVTSITPPGKPAHASAYTPVNLQESYTPPDVGIGPTATTFQYDLDKRLTQINRPDGATVGFSYDATGKLVMIAAPHGSTVFTYDPEKRQLSSIAAPHGETLSYTYDGFLEAGVSWSGTVSGSISRVFDSDFRVRETRVNGGNPVGYQYDADGLITKAGDLTITRSTANGLITGTAIGQVTDSRSYNAFGELATYAAKVGAAPMLSVTYTRDSLGRIAQKVETIEGQATTYDYGYDTAGRLVQVVRTPQGQSALTTSYGYDSNGNRVLKTGPDGTATVGTYDAQDRLLTYGNISYAHNANGDLSSKTQNNATVTYDYDVFDNLRKVSLDTGQVIEYVIDGRNRRVGKAIDGTLVQGFLFDDQLRPIAELDGANTVVATFVYGTRVNVPELIQKGGTTYRIVHDHLGSPRLVIDQGTGAVVQRVDYDEWGQTILDTNPGFQPFGFAGGLYDTHTKLVRFGARDYDPQAGRWTTKDPIRFLGGDPNLFSYVGADPQQHVDPGGDLPTGGGSGTFWRWFHRLHPFHLLHCLNEGRKCNAEVDKKCECVHEDYVLQERCKDLGHGCCQDNFLRCVTYAFLLFGLYEC